MDDDANLGDILTTAIAVLALVVSSLLSVVIHRQGGAIVRVDVKYYGFLKRKSLETLFEKQAKDVISTLSSAGAVHRQFGDDYFVTPFLRVIVTNRGRIDVSVDSILYQNREGRSRGSRQKGDPEYPVPLRAQSYIYLNEPYEEIKAWAGVYGQIRFVVALTNGDEVFSRWIRLLDVPKDHN